MVKSNRFFFSFIPNKCSLTLYRSFFRQTDRQTDRRTEKQTDRPRDKRIRGQSHKRTNRHKDKVWLKIIISLLRLAYSPLLLYSFLTKRGRNLPISPSFRIFDVDINWSKVRIELVSLSQTRVVQELPVPLVHENFFPLEGKRQKLDVKFQVKIILFQTFLLLSYEQKERK